MQCRVRKSLAIALQATYAGPMLRCLFGCSGQAKSVNSLIGVENRASPKFGCLIGQAIWSECVICDWREF